MHSYSQSARIGILLIALAFTPTSWCDDSTAVEGDYVIVVDQRADIDKAIETTIAKMNFITRPIARGRLKETNPVYRHVHIASTGADIEIKYDDRKPIRAPTNGSQIKWTREDGEVFDVTMTRQGGQLLQNYKSKDGMRVNTFRWDDSSQRMYLDVTISSDRLPQPLKYTLAYRRE